MRLTDPSSDLAVAMAMASAYANLPLPTTAVMIGEVGLAGDLRRVTGMDRRLAEAARLGFTTALIPAGLRRGADGHARAAAHPPSARRCEHMIDIADHRASTGSDRRTAHGSDGINAVARRSRMTRCDCVRRCARPSPAWRRAPRCGTAWSASCAAAPAR